MNDSRQPDAIPPQLDSTNPYAATELPPQLNASPPHLQQGVDREYLRSLAQRQREVIYCLLVQILFTIFSPARIMPIEYIVVSLIISLAMQVVALVIIYRLAQKVFSNGASIALCLLGLVPCISLIVLLVVNGKASYILKRNGIQVGLMGADPSRI